MSKNADILPKSLLREFRAFESPITNHQSPEIKNQADGILPANSFDPAQVRR
jgi:hypothetical protein